jgi:hypothetical protein
MDRISLLQRLRGVALGFMAVAFAGICVSIIMMCFLCGKNTYHPTHEDLVFLAKSSRLSLFYWNLIGKITLLVCIPCITLRFWNMYWIVSGLKQGFFKARGKHSLQSAAVFFFTGVVFSKLILNPIRPVDYLTTTQGTWFMDRGLFSTPFYPNDRLSFYLKYQPGS